MKSENAQKWASEPFEGAEAYREPGKGSSVDPDATSLQIGPITGALPCSFCGAATACDYGRWPDGSDCEGMRDWQAQFFQRRSAAMAAPWPIPARYRGATLDPDDRQHGLCRAWADGFLHGAQGCLLLHGPPGTGKTYAACATANLLAQRKSACAFGSNARILTEIRDTYNKDRFCGDPGDETESSILDALEDVPVMILDDMGDAPDSEHAVRTLRQIIDRRYSAGRPLIVTTNIGLGDARLSGRLGMDWQAIISRLTDGATVVKMTNARRVARQVG